MDRIGGGCCLWDLNVKAFLTKFVSVREAKQGSYSATAATIFAEEPTFSGDVRLRKLS